MDDLDRLHRRLVHNIRMTHPEYLRIPFTVRELYEQLVPYRHNRRELAIETNDDYETAVARLLSGERGYIETDPTLQESLKRELVSPTGDPGIFKDHGDARVTLAPVDEGMRTPVPGIAPAASNASNASNASSAASASNAATAPTAVGTASPASVGTAPAGTPGASPPTVKVPVAAGEPSARESVTAAYDAMAPATSIPSANPHVPSLLSSLSQIDVPTGCRFCGGTLPEGREANFCPHCGENLRTKRCPACGSEMDTAWNFCVTCGRRSS